MKTTRTTLSVGFCGACLGLVLWLSCSAPPQKHGPRSIQDPTELMRKIYPDVPEIMDATAARVDPGKIQIVPFKQDIVGKTGSIETIRMAHDRIRGQYCIRFIIRLDQAGINFDRDLRAGRIQVPRYFVEDEFGRAHAGATGSPMRFYSLIKTETGTRAITVQKKTTTVVDSPFYDAPDPKEQKKEESREPSYRYQIKFSKDFFPQVLCFPNKPNDRLLLAIHVRMAYVLPKISEICYKEEIPCPSFTGKEAPDEMRAFCRKHLIRCNTEFAGPEQKCYRFQSKGIRQPCPFEADERKQFCSEPLNECSPGLCMSYSPTCPKIPLFTFRDLAEKRRAALAKIEPAFEKLKGASFVYFEDPYGAEFAQRLEANSKQANAEFTAGQGEEKRTRVSKYGSEIKLMEWTLVSPPKLLRVIEPKP